MFNDETCICSKNRKRGTENSVFLHKFIQLFKRYVEEGDSEQVPSV